MLKTALIFGSTGLTGRYCLQSLLDSSEYIKVVSLVRRSSGLKHAKLQEHIIDFNELEKYASLIQADDVFCCMGTTIRKAGSKENFKKVDFYYPLTIAKIALANGAQQFVLMSSIGANAQSPIFYSRTKGEIENAVQALDYPTVHILRPSVLLGKREEFRFGERMGILAGNAVNFLMVGPLRKYRGIQAEVVAKAMLLYANRGEKGRFVWESDAIQAIGDAGKN